MSTPNPLQTELLSHQEYFGLEQATDQRYEYIAGGIFAMTGGTEIHALIGANTLAELVVHLKDRPCRVYGPDMKLHIAEHDKFCYPDVMALCESGERHRLYIERPMIIVEVLSDTTESYDRGIKFEHYRSIEMLRYYLLLSQDRPHAEMFHREQPDLWTFRETSGMETAIEFQELGFAIGMKDIYRNVEFPNAPEANRSSGVSEK